MLIAAIREMHERRTKCTVFDLRLDVVTASVICHQLWQAETTSNFGTRTLRHTGVSQSYNCQLNFQDDNAASLVRIAGLNEPDFS